MLALKNKVEGIVRYKLESLGIKDFGNLQFPIDEVMQAIQNYCNIKRVPHDLRYTWANMTVDLIRWQLEVKTDNAASDENSPGGDSSSLLAGKATSIKQGDTTVAFGASESSQSAKNINAHNMGAGDDGILDKIVMNYVDSLNKFRQIHWSCFNGF